MADNKDKKISEVPHLENVTGKEKIPVSADDEAGHIEVKQIYDKEVTPYPGDNEIVYTTTDGEAIELDDANIVSNVYYKDKGFGVMTFREPVVESPVFYNNPRASKLETIRLPEGMKIISAKAFSYCEALKDVLLPSTLIDILTDAFQHTALREIIIPDGVSNLGGACFQSCKYLTYVRLPSNLKSLIGAQFEECISLTSIYIPDSINHIGSREFNNCHSLLTLNFPPQLKNFGVDAIANCSSLKYITFPQSTVLQPSTRNLGSTRPVYFDNYFPNVTGWPNADNLQMLVLRYDGVVEDVDTYVSTFTLEEGQPLPVGAKLLPKPENATVAAEDGIMPLTNLDTYIGTPNSWLKIYVPENRLKEYQERYPTLKSHFHPITGEDIYATKDEVEKAIDIVSASGETLNAETGKYYRFEESVNSLEVTLPKISEVSKLCSFVLSFTTGDAPSVTISADSEISYFEGFSIDADTTYELNLMFNGTKWIVAYGVVE